MGKSSVGYRMAMFGLEDHSRPVRGADYFAGHFAPSPFRKEAAVFAEPSTDDAIAAASVLGRYSEDAAFTYALTHVFVDPKAGMRPVERLPDRIGRNLARIRADGFTSSHEEEWLRGQQ